jgi:hypothetical protein
VRPWLLAAVLAAAAPAALAQTTRSHLLPDGALFVATGEKVVLRIAGDGALTMVSAAPAQAADAAPPKPRSGVDPVQAADGAVTLVLGETGGDTLLKLQSGLDKAFDYDADLVQPQPDGTLKQEPTSVCTVLPLLAGYEHWPKRHVIGIVVSRFRLRDTNAVDCPEPTRPQRILRPA